jgi:Arc/MetJ family transcription regulator
MTTQTKRTTIYLDPLLHKALRLKAIAVSRTVSQLVNDAVKDSLKEDGEDNLVFEERADEPLLSYDEIIKSLRKDGRI